MQVLKRTVTRFFLSVSCLLSIPVAAQVADIDSLRKALSTQTEDSSKIAILNEMAIAVRRTSTEQSRDYAQQALTLAQQSHDLKGKARAYFHIANTYYDRGDFTTAIEMLRKTLDIQLTLNVRADLAESYAALGSCYFAKGDYPLALEYQLKGVTLREELGDKKGQGASYNGIGNIYMRKKEFEKALTYYDKALQYFNEANAKSNSASVLNNIGNFYLQKNETLKALEYYKQALQIKKELGDKRGVANTLSNIGVVYGDLNLLDEGIDYTQQALKIREEIGDRAGMAESFSNLAEAYKQKRNFSLSLSYFNQSNRISSEIGTLDLQVNNYKSIAEIYLQQNDYTNAYKNLSFYSDLKDSVFSTDNAKIIAEQQAKFDAVKKEKEIEILSKDSEIKALELSKQDEALKRQQIINYSVVFGLLIVSSMVILLFRNNRLKQKANQMLEQANKLIAGKNELITDSIDSAKIIQDALLVGKEQLCNKFSDAFVFYQPKDIVSGDFYWLANTVGKDDETSPVLLAAADCTGHGVPGAFMTFVGYNLLQNAVKDHPSLAHNPAAILEEVNKGLLQMFKSRSIHNTLKSSMDIALISYAPKEKSIHFAGAYSSLYVISQGELKEYKGNKIRLGGGDTITKTFTNHTIHVHKGDMIYLFSDGFADQLGGPKREKFFYQPFRELLFSAHSLPLDEQKRLIDTTFNDWKGEYAQTDDVMVIGLKL